MKKYTVRVEIEKIIISGYELDAVVRLIMPSSKMNGHSFECFVPKDQDHFRKYGQVEVKFHLLDFNQKILETQQKEIVAIKGRKNGTVNTYTVKGDIVAISEHPRYMDSIQIVIDCGIPIYTRAYKNQNFQIGDYIEIEGRLDIYTTENEK